MKLISLTSLNLKCFNTIQITLAICISHCFLKRCSLLQLSHFQRKFLAELHVSNQTSKLCPWPVGRLFEARCKRFGCKLQVEPFLAHIHCNSNKWSVSQVLRERFIQLFIHCRISRWTWCFGQLGCLPIGLAISIKHRTNMLHFWIHSHASISSIHHMTTFEELKATTMISCNNGWAQSELLFQLRQKHFPSPMNKTSSTCKTIAAKLFTFSTCTPQLWTWFSASPQNGYTKAWRHHAVQEDNVGWWSHSCLAWQHEALAGSPAGMHPQCPTFQGHSFQWTHL